jgi:type II secretory pathway component PulF
MKYEYQAIDKTGGLVSAVTDAKDTSDAIENLRRQGLFVTEIAEASHRAAATRASGVGRGKRLKYGGLRHPADPGA